MAKTKYYAVRAGRTPGIYMTWAECEAQVKGFSGAQYKSFGIRSEAENYMRSGPAAPVDASEGFSPEYPYAFTDGSYNKSTGQAGWGGFLVLDSDGNRHTLQGLITDDGWNAMHNVAGETCGALAAIAKARELKLRTLHIYHDYTGIAFFTDGTWTPSMKETQFYAAAVARARAEGLDIKFHKVAAHTGIPGNEEADRLAKQAVGL